MLPNEILDHIFSFLDHITLKACTVVCPDLAECHLYTTITISDFQGNSHPPLQAFEYVLNPIALDILINKNPRVVQYARTLIIDLPLYDDDKTSFVKLTRLESLTLCHRSGPYHGVWPRLGRDFKLAFLASLRLPCLKEVCILSTAEFPLSALLGCKSLKKLTIQSWDVNTETVQINSQLQNEEPQLESLKLIHNNEAIETLISRANLTNLSHLFLTIAFDLGGDSILRLLQTCSVSLKTLQVYCHRFHAKAHDLHFQAVHQKVHNHEKPISFPAHLLPQKIAFSIYIPITIFRVNERFVSHLPTVSHALHVLANDTSLSAREKTSKCFSLSIYLHFVTRYARFDTHPTRQDLSPLILNCIPTSAKVFRHPIRIFISASEMSGTGIPAEDVLQKFEISSELSSLIEEGVFLISGMEQKRSWSFEYY